MGYYKMSFCIRGGANLLLDGYLSRDEDGTFGERSDHHTINLGPHNRYQNQIINSCLDGFININLIVISEQYT